MLLVATVYYVFLFVKAFIPALLSLQKSVVPYRGNKPGQEIEHPMAIVIIGGLITSTLLNLLFMPALYWKFAKAKNKLL